MGPALLLTDTASHHGSRRIREEVCAGLKCFGDNLILFDHERSLLQSITFNVASFARFMHATVQRHVIATSSSGGAAAPLNGSRIGLHNGSFGFSGVAAYLGGIDREAIYVNGKELHGIAFKGCYFKGR